MKMKYVIVEQLGPCFDVPILFPSFLAHDAMIGKMNMTRSDVISAGKTWIADGKVVVKVGSIGLAVNPQGDDRAERERIDAILLQKAWDFND